MSPEISFSLSRVVMPCPLRLCASARDITEDWVLRDARYVDMPVDAHGHLVTDAMGLSLGVWHGEYQGLTRGWLRFFSPSGEVQPTFAEAEAQRAEAEGQRAEAEAQRAEAAIKKTQHLRERLAAYEARFGPLPDDPDGDEPEPTR